MATVDKKNALGDQSRACTNKQSTSKSEASLPSPRQQARKFTPNGTLGTIHDRATFKIDVSRRFKNKEGAKKSNTYALNMSFQTEVHTIETFIEDVVKQGYPYTMHHAKRSPEGTGAAERGVKTPKHTENFLSMQIITLDDDRAQPDVVDWWMNQDFFMRYGHCFVESTRSEPGAQKGHPTFILDRPVTDAAEWKLIMAAMCDYFPATDPSMKNVDRTVFNGEGANVHVNGETLPNDDLMEIVVNPYRKRKEREEKAAERKVRKQTEAYEAHLRAAKPIPAEQVEAYVTGRLNHKIELLAAMTAGDVNGSRNLAIYEAGCDVAAFKNAEWADNFHYLIADIDDRIVDAAATNGYLEDHANGNPAEILRIFHAGMQRDDIDHWPPPVIKDTGLSDKKRERKQSVEYIEALRKLGYQLRYNSVSREIENNGRALQPGEVENIRMYLNDEGFMASQDWTHVILTGWATRNTYHPVQDYLEGLEWDGEDHFSHLLHYVRFQHGALDGQLFRRWLLGAVGKPYGGPPNFCLVIDGPQGVGKSTLVRKLVPQKLQPYFREAAVRPESKDDQAAACENWIQEVVELQSTTRKADREALKAFLTVTSFKIRNPYDRLHTKRPTLCSFLGTINESGGGFLDDPTGNRRFVVVKITDIDFAYSHAVNIDQLWAQMKAEYDAGERGELTAAETAHKSAQESGYQVENATAEYLWSCYKVDDKNTEWVTSAEILDHLKSVGLRVPDNLVLKQIAEALTEAGVQKGKPRFEGRRLHAYMGLTKKPLSNAPTGGRKE